MPLYPEQSPFADSTEKGNEIIRRSHSCVKEMIYAYYWVIERFDRLLFYSNNPVVGPMLELGPENSNWQLLLSKEYVKDQKSIGFSLSKVDEDSVNDSVDFSIALVSPDGKKLVCVEHCIVGGEDKGCFTYFPEAKPSDNIQRDIENSKIYKESSEDIATLKELVAKELFRKSEEKATLTLDEVFSLSKITIEYLIKYQYIVDFTQDPPDVVDAQSETCEEFKKQLFEDLEDLQRSCKLSDISLIARDENGVTKIPAHKNILCARSSKFNKQLKDQTESTEIDLDMDADTARLFVSFLYSAKIPCVLTENQVEKLAVVAKKYELNNLEDYCGYLTKELGGKRMEQEESSGKQEPPSDSVVEDIASVSEKCVADLIEKVDQIRLCDDIKTELVKHHLSTPKMGLS